MGRLYQNNISRDPLANTRDILLIDDDRTSLHLMSRFLTSIGHKKPRTARSGKAAKRMLKIEPCLIILDLDLPDTNGLLLLSELREKNNQIPVIVVSSSDEFKHVLRALQYDAFWYLKKPINKAEFLEVIKRALELSNLTRHHSILATSLSSSIRKHPESSKPIKKSLGENKALVSELKNILTQIEVVKCKQESENSDLNETSNLLFAGLSLAEIEHRALIETLIACSGNKANSARKLGISEKSIYNMMRRFNIQISSLKGTKHEKIGGLES